MASSKADRQKRFRARQKRNEVVAPVVVNHAIVATMLDLGWLPTRDSEDPRKVGAAIAKMLDDLARSQGHKIP